MMHRVVEARLRQSRILSREPSLAFERLTLSDIDAAVALARRAYSVGFLAPAVDTLYFHAACLTHGMDDGRVFYKVEHEGSLIAVCGLHTYIWGTPTVTWLSWFFVDTGFRRRLLSARMMLSLIHVARRRGYQRLYAETSSNDPSYAVVNEYLCRLGFRESACLTDYYAPGVDQLIYCLDLGNVPLTEGAT
jgi:RimJ/RimL family protein N-acetyltransferase